MILSYSLAVRQVPLHILLLIWMFSYSNFIITDFFSLGYKPDSDTEFIPNSDRFWDKIANMGSTQHHP
jgi:hypothetical protein